MPQGTHHPDLLVHGISQAR